ncbi:MAG TPA: diphthine--ammonia ligase [Steroidobacter sp.]
MTDSVALCSFSGGKDSCLALWRAQQQGLKVRTLLVMFEEAADRSRSHAIPLPMIEAQARALGLELLVRRASWKTYEEVFVAALEELKARGHTHAVFGDIDLQPHRDWEEKVCARAGIEPVLPLWHEDRRALAQEVLDAGFRARVVCVDSRYLGDEFCGREYDASFLTDLPANVDACGENGEFHTFVYDGPNFKSPVPCSLCGCEEYVAPPELGGTRYCFARWSEPGAA